MSRLGGVVLLTQELEIRGGSHDPGFERVIAKTSKTKENNGISFYSEKRRRSLAKQSRVNEAILDEQSGQAFRTPLERSQRRCSVDQC